MRVYVAGPLTRGDWFQNVRRAIDFADEITTVTGFQCFVPHLSLTWDMIHHHGYEWWMDWCMEWVRACDALVRVPGDSPGGDREAALARSLGIPVFDSIEALVEGLVVHEQRFNFGDEAIDCLNENGGKIRMSTCPCCEGNVKVYPRKLHADMAYFLILLKRACDKEFRFYHPRDLAESGEKASTDASYLDLWGLVEKNAKLYSITDMGIGFVMGRFPVPRTAHVLSPPKTVLRWSEEETTIQEALGDKFDYDELMGY